MNTTSVITVSFNGVDTTVPQMVVDMVKQAFKNESGDDTTLNDDEIALLVLEQGDDASSLDASDWADIVSEAQSEDTEEGEQDAPLDVSVSEVREQELKLAEKLQSDEWKEFQSDDIKAHDFRKQASVKALFLIRKDFTEEEIDALPLFGTVAHNEKTGERSNNPDVYFVKGRNNKQEKRHRIWDIVDYSHIGKGLHTRHSKLYEARHKIEGFDKALANMGDEWLDSEIASQKQRINQLRKSFVEGLQLRLKSARINAEMPKVQVDIAMDQRGNIKQGAYCIELSVRNSKAHQFITASNVLRSNIEQALKNGGTMADLVSTFKKKKGTQQPAPASTVKMPNDKEEAYSMVNMLVQYFDMNSKDGRNRIAAIVNEATSKSEGSASARVALGDLYLALDGIYPKFEKQYQIDKAELQKVEQQLAAPALKKAV